MSCRDRNDRDEEGGPPRVRPAHGQKQRYRHDDSDKEPQQRHEGPPTVSRSLICRTPSPPAAAAGETLNPENASCRRGPVPRRVRRDTLAYASRSMKYATMAAMTIRNPINTPQPAFAGTT